jgi:hypothetical protein
MKTLKIFGMAAIAVLIGVGFVSCSKENPEGNEDFSNEKKLVEMDMRDEEGKTLEKYTFEYDDKGKLVESTGSIDYGASSVSATYIWGEEAIQIDNANTLSSDYTLSLSNGLVQSSSDGDTFTYNSLNRITNWNNATALWEGDKVMSISDGLYKYTLTYGETSKKGYYPMIPYFMGYMSPTEMMLFIAHPEIVGMRTKQLATKVSGLSFTYEFDADGYISKLKFNNRVAILTWK